MGTLILFHGSRQIVTRPQLSKGKEHNDYGRGFYCTDDEDLAGEWACRDDTDGFVNRYRLDTEGLKMLDLCDEAIITYIHKTFEADAYFPNLDKADDWELVNEEPEILSEVGVSFNVRHYKRKNIDRRSIL